MEWTWEVVLREFLEAEPKRSFTIKIWRTSQVMVGSQVHQILPRTKRHALFALELGKGKKKRGGKG